MIQVDAYQDITIPFQMSSAEFFTLVKEHLAPSGVMVVNLNMHSDGEGSINQALCDTIASLFPHVYTVDIPGATNRELFASMDGDPTACATMWAVSASSPTTKPPWKFWACGPLTDSSKLSYNTTRKFIGRRG